MQCPDCGGPMWDNRQTKKNPKQPDYKCKDKEGCGKGVWEEKKQGGTPANGTAAADLRAKRPLGRLYYESMKIAAATVKHHLGDKATAADVIAATATVFIAATNTGAPLTAPPKASPPPPPPKPEPEPEPEHEYADDSDLPF